ncbi:MAG: enoyl-CoA hydratase/isomerase family protein [Candidatus Promineifilaceae bacterium]|jgi:enoyl-CoA hydratase/carnithine racemase
MKSYKNWIVEERAHVATFLLNRQAANDSIDTETMLELGEISAAIRERSEIWTVVLRSAGKHFSTGLDPNLIRRQMNESEETIRKMIAEHQQSLAQFEKIGKPVVAAIHGFCIGAGVLLALCCDFRIASERSVFSLPEIRLGIPILWGSHRIVRTLGSANAKRMIMLADKYRAKQALELGLVHSVVKDGELDAAVERMVSKLHRSPPLTQFFAKQFVDSSLAPEVTSTEKLELDAIPALLNSPDVTEAIERAFDGKTPNYIGR